MNKPGSLTKILPRPARYFPLSTGRYEVGPGLRSLSTDFGNGVADAHIYQLDCEFPKYRENKLRARAERFEKYCATSDYSPELSHAVNRSIVEKLCQEHPAQFRWEREAAGGGVFHCSLTDEQIPLNESYELAAEVGDYRSAFDALCCQVQEDVAIMQLDQASGRNWLSAIHLCSPSHWAAEEKIGKAFNEIHVPVPGIEKVNRASPGLVDAMVNKGPYVRFVWGFGTDRYLNHHPEPAPGHDPVLWKGRAFGLGSPQDKGSPFILRVERQVLYGLPEVSAAVFTIRLYFIDGAEIRANPVEKELLVSTLRSMSPESVAYKGLTESMGPLLEWLEFDRA